MTAPMPSEAISVQVVQPRIVISRTASSLGVPATERSFEFPLPNPLERLRQVARQSGGFQADTGSQGLRDLMAEYFAWSQWQRPCREMFERLVNEDPDVLLLVIRSGALKPALLTFAAETAGSSDSNRVAPLLLELLHHDSPLVREGAIYGLRAHSKDAGVRGQFQRLLESDPVEGVRDAALEAFGIE
jgi:HEAT repeats